MQTLVMCNLVFRLHLLCIVHAGAAVRHLKGLMPSKRSGRVQVGHDGHPWNAICGGHWQGALGLSTLQGTGPAV